MPKLIRHITNVWTVYRLNPDGTETDGPFIAEMSRPQDWGNPKRWKYKVYTLSAQIKDTKYEHEVHCWAELPIEDYKHLELFSGVIAQIMLPGTPVQKCSNKYLQEDDFWMEEWGELPPYPEDPGR